MMKTALTSADLEAQAILELPDRELLGGLITVYSPITLIDLYVLNVLLKNNFNNWNVNVLSGNKVEIEVGDVLSDNDIAVFCNQVITVLSAQCFGKTH
jgi:hypothetical protein